MEYDQQMTPRASRNASLATRLRTVDEPVRAGGGGSDNRVTGVAPPLQVPHGPARRGERAGGEAARRPLRELRRGAWTSATSALLDGPTAEAGRELWCRECGYGAIVRGDPPACPMCHATSWVERSRRAPARRRIDHAL
jgi:hypothetical protein